MTPKKRKLQEGKKPQPQKEGEDGPPLPKKQAPNKAQVKKEAVAITGINVASFAEHRSIEIQAMTELVKDTGGNHTAFQKLPRHMRRRAMSHNIKRIPRRLHTTAKLELSKTKTPEKRPSRRHRRRPSNLLSEYERRKRKIGWLETHIWHAKRFKMVQKWGYKLALHPNDKSIRACYRAVKRHCLLQDVSFETYIELKGQRQAILDGLGHLTSSETGPTFAAKMTSCGTRQGNIVLYCFNCYPFSAIGAVTYLWRPQSQEGSSELSPRLDTLWISCHPSIYNLVLAEIKKCFAPQDVDESACDLKDKIEVTVKPLKDQLVKFRLFGPASNLVLAETLKAADVESNASTFPSVKEEQAEESTIEETLWWKNYYSCESKKQEFRKQSELWSKVAKCQSPSEVPPDTILALTVRDPRLMLPPKRNKANMTGLGSVTKILPMDLFNDEIAMSPVWESVVREEVKATKITEQKLNLMKSKHLVPGTPLQQGDKESRIPVLLIQRPGASHLASSLTNPCHSCGWDLIIPSGFAMAFWVALVYRGARVGGIREAQSTALQAGLLSVPEDYPDSSACQEEHRAESEARQAKYNRMPPAKRPNFVKLGVLTPFQFDFESLVKEWHDKWINALGSKVDGKAAETRAVRVLRNRKMLRLLNSALTNPKTLFKTSLKSKAKGLKNGYEQSETVKILSSTEIGSKLLSEELISVVPVRLSVLQRGVPASYGHICLPSGEDFKALNSDKAYGGPFEPKHRDPGLAARKKERKERLRLRKRQKRGKAKKAVNGSEPKDTENPSGHPDQKTFLATKQDENDIDKKVMGSTTRDIIGYVKDGAFDLVTGQGLGYGFCSVPALINLIEQQQDRKTCHVLIRNSTSLQYRFASVSLLA